MTFYSYQHDTLVLLPFSDTTLPVLPPPPKNATPTLVRRNPFNKAESSDEESISIPVPSISTTSTTNADCLITTHSSDTAVLSSEINQTNENECLIEGGMGNVLYATMCILLRTEKL